MECYTIIAPGNPNPILIQTIFTTLYKPYNDTRSGRPRREFCTDTFRLAIRESRARDVYATNDDITSPHEPLYVIVSVIVGFRNLSNHDDSTPGVLLKAARPKGGLFR